MSQPEFATRFVTIADVLDAYDQVISHLTGLMGNISEAQYDVPTPCSEWNLRDLLCHLAFVNERYAAVAERAEHPPFNQSFYLDPVVAFAEWHSRARAAFHQDAFLTTSLPTPIGEYPGNVVVQHVVNELMVHAWDLARALGKPTDVLPELATACLTSWQEVYAELGQPPRSPATVDVSLPAGDGASAADRLAAYMGRKVD